MSRSSGQVQAWTELKEERTKDFDDFDKENDNDEDQKGDDEKEIMVDNKKDNEDLPLRPVQFV